MAVARDQYLDLREGLLDGLTADQRAAVGAPERRLLVVAGAGSGKTEVIARRVAWWVAVESVPKEAIVAFTFTERAAEELQFRIRRAIGKATPLGGDPALGGMYIGTIHAFCLQLLREIAPDAYHNIEILDEAARGALVERGYYEPLGLDQFQFTLGEGRTKTVAAFLHAYDLLNEFAALEVVLPQSATPTLPQDEVEWCSEARLDLPTGTRARSVAFGAAAARYYAYLRCRRFLDFSTVQTELLRLLDDPEALAIVRERLTHLVVDEVQDLNPVQDALIRKLVGHTGSLAAVGDHRQAIYAFRGGQVTLAMGDLHAELSRSADAAIVALGDNFRSTPRIVALANAWQSTIGPVGDLISPDMRAGDVARVDTSPDHVAALAFGNRDEEAEWIAGTIAELVGPDHTGAAHGGRGGERGIAHADIAILLRAGTDAKAYLAALERRGIPAVVRAGPDLFARPEVLLLLGALARAAGLALLPDDGPRGGLAGRAAEALAGATDPAKVIEVACIALRAAGLPLPDDTGARLLLATALIDMRLQGGPPVSSESLAVLRTPELARWLARPRPPARLFPQMLYHLLLAEAGVASWGSTGARGTAALFHLGQLSALVARMEAPGWTTVATFPHQMRSLLAWGAGQARAGESPLLVSPDAVSIMTVHAAKGLEFAAVFVADVTRGRFPSGQARRLGHLPFDGPLARRIDPRLLADNANMDGERRLMYVALTRAERYLFVTSPDGGLSSFFTEVAERVGAVGGAVPSDPHWAVPALRRVPSVGGGSTRLATSFSELRHYLECPQDFYLRTVLGFAPAIGQEFGYGLGIHNLLRSIHTAPRIWAPLAEDKTALEAELLALVERGLFYLRHTSGAPLARMRARALAVVAEYVRVYQDELAGLVYEPERRFETLVEEADLLVTGTIDIVRRDDPPRVTLIDFKSGEPDADVTPPFDEGALGLQLRLYGLAASQELGYRPERGLVRYLAERDPARREFSVDLGSEALDKARESLKQVAGNLRRREFHGGPQVGPRVAEHPARCVECDFFKFCGHEMARGLRAAGHESAARPYDE